MLVRTTDAVGQGPPEEGGACDRSVSKTGLEAATGVGKALTGGRGGTWQGATELLEGVLGGSRGRVRDHRGDRWHAKLRGAIWPSHGGGHDDIRTTWGLVAMRAGSRAAVKGGILVRSRLGALREPQREPRFRKMVPSTTPGPIMSSEFMFNSAQRMSMGCLRRMTRGTKMSHT